MIGKYGKLTSSEKEFIEDEPIFVIRGKDLNAIDAIEQYRIVASVNGATEEFLNEIAQFGEAVGEWQDGNPDICKYAD